MRKIALTGISGSGKDYIVERMVDKYGFTRVSFSDQLKKKAAEIYPWLETDYAPFEKETPLNIKTSEEEVITDTPRQIWLKVGAALRSVENKMFVRMLKEELSRTNVQKVVISDIRPRIEWDWCNKEGFETVYVDPLEFHYQPNDFDEQVFPYKDEANHVFENHFDGYEKVDRFIEDVLGIPPIKV